MKCPDCDLPMLVGLILECRTGNARQFVCGKCGAKHWQQITTAVNVNFHPLRETNARAAAKCFA